MSRVQIFLGCLVAALLGPGPTGFAQERPPIEIVPQVTHSQEIRTMASSLDGAYVVSGGLDGTVKLWETTSGRFLRSFDGHTGYILSLSFSPDRALVASGNWDKTVKVWKTVDRQVVRTLEVGDYVEAVAFSPDGARLQTAGRDGAIKLWDVATGRELRSVTVAWAQPASSVFSQDGNRLLTGDYKNGVNLWETATGRLLRTFSGHTKEVRSVAFSPDGTRILSGSEDKSVKVWNANTGELQNTFQFEGYSGATYVVWAPGGKMVFAGNSGGEIASWDVETGRPLYAGERTHLGHIRAGAFSPDGSRIVVAAGNDLKLLDSIKGLPLGIFGSGSPSFGEPPVKPSGSIEDSKKLTKQITWNQGRLAVSSVAMSPNGSRLLSGGANALRLWDFTTGRLLRSFDAKFRSLESVRFSLDGSRVMAVDGVGAIQYWDMATGRWLGRFEGHSTQIVWKGVLSPDGTRAVSARETKGPDLAATMTVALSDTMTGAILRSFDGTVDWKNISSVALSKDGSRMVTGHWDHVLVWDAAQGKILRRIAEGYGSGAVVALSLDGLRVLTNSEKSFTLWDANSGKLLRTFGAHAATITSIIFSPDGTRALSGSQDKTVKLWDLDKGELLRTFAGGSTNIQTVAFSPDGTRTLSGSEDGTIRIWYTATGRELAKIIAWSPDDWLALTPQGFFDRGGATDELLHIGQGLEVTTIGRVHQSLYSPDLVREALANDPDGEVRKAVDVISLDKVLRSGPAPAVTITSHPKQSKSEVDLVALTVQVADGGKGIGRIEWRVNGVTAAVISKLTGKDLRHTLTQQLALEPGDNAIEVIAYNASNLLASQPAHIAVKFVGAVDAAKPKLHVLAIGINAYADIGWTPPGQKGLVSFPPLALAVKDATTFAEEIKQAGKAVYKDVNVTLVVDKAATRENLDRIIDKLAGEVQPRDTFILFVAGHGISENGKFYMIPQDYQGGPGSLDRGAIGQDRLQDWLANRIKAKKAIILLDTCESGALVAGYARSRSDSSASEASVGRLHEATGRPVLTAAASGRPALEGYKGHGVFTWTILDALKNGDTNSNGYIELSELVAHVQQLVPKISVEMGGVGRSAIALTGPIVEAQSARFGAAGGDFILARRVSAQMLIQDPRRLSQLLPQPDERVAVDSAYGIAAVDVLAKAIAASANTSCRERLGLDQAAFKKGARDLLVSFGPNFRRIRDDILDSPEFISEFEKKFPTTSIDEFRHLLADPLIRQRIALLEPEVNADYIDTLSNQIDIASVIGKLLKERILIYAHNDPQMEAIMLKGWDDVERALKEFDNAHPSPLTSQFDEFWKEIASLQQASRWKGQWAKMGPGENVPGLAKELSKLCVG